MKHAIQIIAILLVIMLLTGCTTNTTNTTNPTDSTSQITDNLVDTVKNDFRGDAAGDWVMRRQYSVGTFSDDGYYYTSPEGFLYFYDPARMVSVRLCSDLNCLHEEETQYDIYENCEAFIGGNWMRNTLFFTNDALYYIDKDYYGTYLYSRDPAGMNEKEVASFAQGYWKPDRSLIVNDALVHNGKLYYTVDVEGSVWHEEEQVTYVEREFSVICCMDLQTGVETELVRTGREEQLILAAVSDDVILCQVAASTGTEDARNVLYTLILHSTKGLGSRIVKQSNTNMATFFDIQDGVFFTEEKAEDGTVSMAGYDLLTSEIKTSIQLPEKNLQYLNGQYRLQYTPVHGTAFSIYDINTGTFLDGPVNGKYAHVYNVSDTGFILKASIFDKESGEYQAHQLFYCSFNSVEDGFQKEDLHPILTIGNAE